MHNDRRASVSRSPSCGGPADIQGGTAEEKFYRKLDEELQKIGDFSVSQMTQLRTRIGNLSEQVEAFVARCQGGVDKESDEYKRLQAEAKAIGSDYLAMEKFVNLNYMGAQQNPSRQLSSPRTRHMDLAEAHTGRWTA